MKEDDSITLNWFLLDQAAKDHVLSAGYFFRGGLQRFLTAMIAVICADRLNREIRPEFTGRFMHAFEKPSLGGLLEFAIWLCEAPESLSVQSIEEYIQTESRKGWLKSMIQLRNQWAHPKKDSPEVILERAQLLIHDMPDFQGFGFFSINDAPAPAWISRGNSLDLSPFFWMNNGVIETFTHMDAERCLRGQTQIAPTEDRFAQIWKRWRQEDRALMSPSIEEFHDRIRMYYFPQGDKGPWWLKKVMRSGAIGILTYPDLLDDIGGQLKKFWNNANVIRLRLSKGQTPFESMKTMLGLMRAPKIDDFARMVDDNHRLVIILDAREIGTFDMSYLLFWLADLNELGLRKHIRIFIGRSKESLTDDFIEIEDNMPDKMDELLGYPPGIEPRTLSDCLWSLDLKRAFLPF